MIRLIIYGLLMAVVECMEEGPLFDLQSSTEDVTLTDPRNEAFYETWLVAKSEELLAPLEPLDDETQEELNYAIAGDHKRFVRYILIDRKDERNRWCWLLESVAEQDILLAFDILNEYFESEIPWKDKSYIVNRIWYQVLFTNRYDQAVFEHIQDLEDYADDDDLGPDGQYIFNHFGSLLKTGTTELILDSFLKLLLLDKDVNLNRSQNIILMTKLRIRFKQSSERLSNLFWVLFIRASVKKDSITTHFLSHVVEVINCDSLPDLPPRLYGRYTTGAAMTMFFSSVNVAKSFKSGFAKILLHFRDSSLQDELLEFYEGLFLDCFFVKDGEDFVYPNLVSIFFPTMEELIFSALVWLLATLDKYPDWELIHIEYKTSRMELARFLETLHSTSSYASILKKPKKPVIDDQNDGKVENDPASASTLTTTNADHDLLTPLSLFQIDKSTILPSLHDTLHEEGLLPVLLRSCTFWPESELSSIIGSFYLEKFKDPADYLDMLNNHIMPHFMRTHPDVDLQLGILGLTDFNSILVKDSNPITGFQFFFDLYGPTDVLTESGPVSMEMLEIWLFYLTPFENPHHVIWFSYLIDAFGMIPTKFDYWSIFVITCMRQCSYEELKSRRLTFDPSAPPTSSKEGMQAYLEAMDLAMGDLMILEYLMRLLVEYRDVAEDLSGEAYRMASELLNRSQLDFWFEALENPLHWKPIPKASTVVAKIAQPSKSVSFIEGHDVRYTIKSDTEENVAQQHVSQPNPQILFELKTQRREITILLTSDEASVNNYLSNRRTLNRKGTCTFYLEILTFLAKAAARAKTNMDLLNLLFEWFLHECSPLHKYRLFGCPYGRYARIPMVEVEAFRYKVVNQVTESKYQRGLELLEEMEWL